MTNYSPVNWTYDLFPEHHKYLTFLKKVYRHEFRKNWYRRISVPLLEKNEIIEKSGFNINPIFTSNDFDINQNPSLSIVRAYLDNEQKEEIQPVYYYYMDRFYKKSEDSLRELDLIWTEIIWENDPILDAIQIYINTIVLDKIGLKGKYTLSINSTWILKEKLKYREELVTYFDNKRHVLSEKSQNLIDTDPMQIFLSKEEDDIILSESAVSMYPKFLKKDSKAHYEKLKEYLDLLEVSYKEDHTLVSDSDTQTNTVFQIVNENSEVMVRWSRHNSLAKNLWEAKEIPATGFFADTEVIVKTLIENNIKIKNKDKIDLFIVQLWDEAKSIVLPLSLKARDAWINTVVSLWTPSMKEQMLKAQRSKAKYIVMVGIMEARNGIFQVRNEEDGTQEEVKKEDLINYMIEKIGQENLDFYSPAKDLIIE